MSAPLHIQLLGGFRLSAGDAPVAGLDSPRLQALVAFLLLHRDSPQRRSHLAFVLWPDSAEAQARGNLRTLLHRLQQALPAAADLLLIDAQHVQWRPDGPYRLDLVDFQAALDRAASAEQARDRPALRAALAAAAEQYGGDLLPGWYDDWVLAERERLRARFLSALLQLTLLAEQEGDYLAAIGAAQRLLRHDPLHETTYQQLMRLHALRGDHASAVRAYKTCRAVLERELGVEPSPATEEAYRQLMRLGAQSSPRPPPPPRPVEPAPPARHDNLPLTLTSFVGRQHERAEVTRLLGAARLVTLTGPGGVGKTRLALAVAAQQRAAFPDGVWLVELAALTDPALVTQAVTTALGLREQGQHGLAALAETLRQRRLLLVLDNCEHLVAACAELAHELLQRCPALTILATSREGLGLPGERAWAVPSLAVPDTAALTLDELTRVESVRLFVERATAALPTFVLAPQGARAVAQICRRLDGIPLALELAAARVKVLSLDQIAARLDNCFQLLTAGSRTVLPRHQTLRAAIDWSYDLLGPAERRLLRRLSVFANGWTLEAAEAICSDPGAPSLERIGPEDVLDLLALLVDKSLVAVEAHQEQVRYRLLETVRIYGAERLREEGVAGEAEARHAAFYLALAEAAEPHLREGQPAPWLNHLEADHDNLRVALDRLAERDPAAGLRLAVAVSQLWLVRGYIGEGRRRLDGLLEAAGKQLTPLHVRALNASGLLAWSHADYAAARARCEAALSIAEALADKAGVAGALRILGRTARYQGDYASARALFERSLAISRGLGDRWGIAAVLHFLGDVLMMQGDRAGAEAHLEESLRLARELGDMGRSSRILHSLGGLALARGDVPAAARLFEEYRATCDVLGDQMGRFYAYNNLGELARVRGEHGEAERWYREGLAVAEELGFRWGEAWLLHNLGYVALRSGDTPRAAELFRRSAAHFRELGGQDGLASCLAGLAGTLGAAGGDTVTAARLLGAAEAALERLGAVFEPADRIELEHTRSTLESVLGPAGLAAAREAGRAIELEAALGIAARLIWGPALVGG